MNLNLIEINDSALSVTRDGVVVASSPGVAVADARQVVTGAPAEARAHREPRGAYRHFWQQLNDTPFHDGQRHCRHHADLAYHHLRSVLDAAGRPAEAVLAVPAHYSREQLALLLGIADAAGLKVGGLVDSAVASAAGSAPPGQYVLLDLHQHHVSVTALDIGEAVVRGQVDTIEQAGWHRIHTAAIDLIAEALLAQARFDALHEAATEQLLHEHLPRWLAQAANASEVRVTIDHHAKRFSARLAARDFERITHMVLAAVTTRLPPARAVLASARLAALPGATALLAPLEALPNDACWRGVVEHRAALAGAAGGLTHVTRLPACATPRVTAPAARTRSAPGTAPSHVLAGEQARALGPQPLYLHADGRLASAALGACCSLTLAGTGAVLRANGCETHVNGVAIAGTALVKPGDHITLAGGRQLFIPILVLDDRAP